MNQSKIALAALMLQKVNHCDFNVRSFIDSLSLNEEDGYRYGDCRSLVMNAGQELRRVPGELGGNPERYRALESVEFELLIVDKGIKPHYHKHSDSVVLVWKDSRAQHEYLLKSKEDQITVWNQLHPGNVLFLPRGVIHGFRPGITNWLEPVVLFVASFPPIVDDVHEVDI